MDAHGNAVIVWLVETGLSGRRITASGAPGPIHVLEPPTALGPLTDDPHVAVDQAGNATVVWRNSSVMARTSFIKSGRIGANETVDQFGILSNPGVVATVPADRRRRGGERHRRVAARDSDRKRLPCNLRPPDRAWRSNWRDRDARVAPGGGLSRLHEIVQSQPGRRRPRRSNRRLVHDHRHRRRPHGGRDKTLRPTPRK